MKNFVKKGELSLINGGYLVNKDENPVTNAAFVQAQERAEYVITFAKMAKGKNFVATKADSLEDLVREVNKAVAKNKPTVFVTSTTTFSTPLADKLKEEALNFLKFKGEDSKIDKINNFLQEFVVLQEFNDFGLFFEDGVVKLNQIYSITDVVSAVTEIIDFIK